MNERVLFVDDEPEVLSAFRRQFHRDFRMETASSGAAALAMLDPQAPFAVIVADMRMPQMDGVQLLGCVKERAPRTVRMMLTGNTDTATAIQAVNEGHIFRFLTKPCSTDSLARALTAGIEQYRLLEAEKELLEKTLRGSVKVLTDTLSLLNPLAFSRGTRIRVLARKIAEQLALDTPWQYELAAMLSQIGCVAVPLPVLEKALTGKHLNEEENAMFSSHPFVGSELLANIPRLERVALMIQRQQEPFRSFPASASEGEDADIAAGANLLKACLDFDLLIQQGIVGSSALKIMQRREGEYNPRMLAAVFAVEGDDAEPVSVCDVTCEEVRPDMVAAEHVRSKSGFLVVPRDQEFTPQVIARLRNFALRGGIQEPFMVYVRKAGGKGANPLEGKSVF